MTSRGSYLLLASAATAAMYACIYVLSQLAIRGLG